MPLLRLQVRNACAFGQTELHRNVDPEDPKSILDGLAVSGLLGVLRQLGDLTQFATEIFHGIQEQVMITTSRSNKLKMRLKQIEATLPSIQKSVLAQTSHIHFAYSGGLEWHPRLPNLQNHFICDDLPEFIMAPYEDCRDPPRLHLLDKFDINGPGSCLKRYSDPTHFKTASKHPDIKKKYSMQRSRASMANQSDRKISTSLSFSGQTSSSKTASTVEVESKSILQDHRSCSFDSRSGGEKLKGLFTSSRFTPGSRTIASVLSDTESEDVDDSPSQDRAAHGSSCISWHSKTEIAECATDGAPEVMETNFVGTDMDSEDETESDGDDFVDALYTIESESENDQVIQNSEERLENSVCEQQTENILANVSDEETLRVPVSDLHLAASPVIKPDELIHRDSWPVASDISNGTTHRYANGFSNPLYDASGIQEHQESEAETESVKTWTNGNLLGLEPSKPKIVAEATPANDEHVGETFQESYREDNAPFDWFTSSPPLDHMKISFNPSEALPSSEMKLKLPDEYTFSSFQLVPETVATSLPDSDSDKDTFCRSSSYISDNRDDDCSVSVSEQQWEEDEESGEIHESKSQQKLYDSFERINAETSRFLAPSPKIETASGNLVGNLSYLQNPAEPLPPPLPPLQWMVSKIRSGRFEDNNKQSLKDTLIRAFEQKYSLSTVKKEEPSVVTAYDRKPENSVHQRKNVRDYKQSHGHEKETEAGDFLHQIRTKQFNLRPVVTTKTSSSDATMNTHMSVILEKANSIRQAVASDDGDGESDSWSSSDT